MKLALLRTDPLNYGTALQISPASQGASRNQSNPQPPQRKAGVASHPSTTPDRHWKIGATSPPKALERPPLPIVLKSRTLKTGEDDAEG
jgi:hypothetical protein